MGPILIFDKSLLESLNENEAVFLDSFFMSNIVPTFYIETLADYAKENKAGKITRSSEQIVREIVKKTPIMEATPNMHYRELVVGDLLGYKTEISEHPRPIVKGGNYRQAPDGSIEIDFKEFPEDSSLRRWQNGNFEEVEKMVAFRWREMVDSINVDALVNLVLAEVPSSTHFSNMEDIKRWVTSATNAKFNQFIHFALETLEVPQRFRRDILRRWYSTRPLPFSSFAPYAAFVLRVNMFFYLCLSKSFLALSHKNKNTNLIDLSYLYYLPFCSVFSSCDSFHKKVAPYFLEDYQTFVDGHDLKDDLAKIIKYYEALPDDIKALGTLKFATYPPIEIETLIGGLCDKHMSKKWRESAKKHWDTLKEPIPQDKELFAHFEKMKNESKPYQGPPISSDEARGMMVTRKVPVKRGNWRILPVGIEDKVKANKAPQSVQKVS